MDGRTAAFTRWRDAPAVQRDAIARQQAMTVELPPVYGRLADMTEAELRQVMGLNGKPLGDCTPAELGEMYAWMRALRDAANELCGATDLSLRLDTTKI